MNEDLEYHPDYKTYQPLWEKAHDAVAGQDAVKAKSTKYLPMTAGMARDKKHGSLDYKNYLQRAVFLGFSGTAVENLVGLLFQKPATNSVVNHIPTDNLDNNFTSLQGFHKNILAEMLTTNRVGLRVDFDDERRQPYCEIWQPQNIINHKFDPLTGDLIEVSTLYTEIMEGEKKTINQKHVLLSDGYQVMDYLEPDTEKGQKEWALIRDTKPKKQNGKSLDYIPFVVVSDKGLTFDFVNLRLGGVFNLELSHYQNSADLESLSHHLGQPTRCGFGIQADDAARFIPGPTQLNYFPNDGAKISVSEFTGQGAKVLMELMDRKEKQMSVLTTRMLETPRMSVESDATLQMRMLGDKSNLERAADASVQAMHWVFSTMYDFLNVSEEPPKDYDLDRTSFPGVMAPQMMRELRETKESGNMSQRVMLWNYERGNLYPEGHGWKDEQALISGGDDGDEFGAG